MGVLVVDRDRARGLATLRRVGTGAADEVWVETIAAACRHLDAHPVRLVMLAAEAATAEAVAAMRAAYPHVVIVQVAGNEDATATAADERARVDAIAATSRAATLTVQLPALVAACGPETIGARYVERRYGRVVYVAEAGTMVGVGEQLVHVDIPIGEAISGTLTLLAPRAQRAMLQALGPHLANAVIAVRAPQALGLTACTSCGASVAHAIRNSLAVLRGNAEFLADEAGPGEAIADLLAGIDHLEQLARDVRLLGAAQDGRFSASATIVVLAPMVADTLQTRGPAVAARSLTVALAIAAEHAVLAVPSVLSRLLEFVLDAAIGRAARGDTLEVTTASEAPRVRLTVQIHGAGAATRVAPSGGLALRLLPALVAASDGTIAFEEAGTVTLRLPGAVR